MDAAVQLFEFFDTVGPRRLQNPLRFGIGLDPGLGGLQRALDSGDLEFCLCFDLVSDDISPVTPEFGGNVAEIGA